MDLSAFKEAMTSDAMKENEQLKEELESLRKEYKSEVEKLSKTLKGYQDDCRALANRCWTLTGFRLGSDTDWLKEKLIEITHDEFEEVFSKRILEEFTTEEL